MPDAFSFGHARLHFRRLLVGFLFAGFLILPQFAQAQVAPINPQVQISIQNGPGGNGNLSINLQLLILFTVLSVAPSLLIMMTSFVRVIIVLSFLRSGLSLQQPSNQVMLSLALFITFFIWRRRFRTSKRTRSTRCRRGRLRPMWRWTAGSTT